jgi:thiamine-phosphate pyrophosphorylase
LPLGGGLTLTERIGYSGTDEARTAMKRPVDFSLYLVTDRRLSLHRTIEEVVRLAVHGGVTVVQLREKDCSTREYVELAYRVKAILEPLRVPLIINDRVDVALAVGADGIHIGQNDMPYTHVRRLMGPEAIVGLSVETIEQGIEAGNLDVDYLGVSPIFSTPTKTDTTTEWGIEGLRLLRSKSRHPLVAIGGVDPSNAQAIVEAGADGLAVVSAVCAAADPKDASRQLRRIIEQTRRAMTGSSS